MKKTTRRLGLTKETLRPLAPLELGRAAGGNDTKLCTYPICAPTALTCHVDTMTCYY